MDDMPHNQMAQAASPYLRQHKDNPVHWQPWGLAAFAAARAGNKPVLLSVGYAACHWCHVMAHESFDNPAIARLINSRFVAIKLDREERPDLDALYQQALALMGKAGGWPLTMFLTPDGVPFWGGTYFPPLARHGLPGFADVLAGIADSYAHDGDAVAFNATSIRAAIAQNITPPSAAVLTPEIVARAATHLLGDIDAQGGSLGTAPKFPQLTKLRLLFDHGLRSGEARYGDAVLQALVQMCRGGLYDHLGGGFHRYCVDAHWLTPHFEKMLDDQSQFIALLADVLSLHPHPLLQQALEDSIAFVLRDLRDDNTGLYISSLDADSDGGEGAYYQWSYDDVAAALGDHAALFCTVYDIRRGGNWDDPHQHQGNILNRLSSTALLTREEEDLLRAMRKKLLYARQLRPAPARDDKIVTDLNARLISALATAGWRQNNAVWRAAAQEAFDKLTALTVTENGSVRHLAAAPAACLLDDSAHLAASALTLATTCDGPEGAQYLAWAKKLARRAMQDFVEDDGSVLPLARREQDSFASIPPFYDTPAPAAAGALLRVLTGLAQIASDDDFTRSAAHLAHILSGPARTDFTMMASTLSALQFYQNPVIIRASALWDEHLRPYTPDSLRLHDPGTSLSVCIGTRCLAPAYTPDAAQRLLNDAVRAGLHKPANG